MPWTDWARPHLQLLRDADDDGGDRVHSFSPGDLERTEASSDHPIELNAARSPVSPIAEQRKWAVRTQFLQICGPHSDDFLDERNRLAGGRRCTTDPLTPL